MDVPSSYNCAVQRKVIEAPLFKCVLVDGLWIVSCVYKGNNIEAAHKLKAKAYNEVYADILATLDTPIVTSVSNAYTEFLEAGGVLKLAAESTKAGTHVEISISLPGKLKVTRSAEFLSISQVAAWAKRECIGANHPNPSGATKPGCPKKAAAIIFELKADQLASLLSDSILEELVPE